MVLSIKRDSRHDLSFSFTLSYKSEIVLLHVCVDIRAQNKFIYNNVWILRFHNQSTAGTTYV